MLTPTYSKEFFLSILNESRAECLKYSLPRKDEIVEILRGHEGVFVKRDAAEKKVNELKKQQASPDEIKAAAGEHRALNQEAQNQMEKTIEVLVPILENDALMDRQSESLHIHLMKCAIISQQGFRSLPGFCKNNDPKYIMDLLENEDVMKEMLVNGGAIKGQFANAYKLYDELMEIIEEDESSFSDCHRRLAMGVALELAVPITTFGTKTALIDPKNRFLHYVNAHKNGELDPSFPYFTVWEYRLIVNSDATDEELQWGRDQLKRYRPDLLNPDKSSDKYCAEVMTDVAYKRPDWGPGRHTFRKLISGGGKCGPRAWMGRFLCKAFGVPTWGVKQRGHAALARWTPDVGWETCLGRGLRMSFWEGITGDDFKMEADARYFQKDLEEYFLKVTLLQCMAQACQEKPIGGGPNRLDPNGSLWRSLVRIQLRSWADGASKVQGCYRRDPKNGENPEDCTIRTFLSRNDKPTDDNRIETTEGGQVRVPACAFSDQEGIVVHRCFEGGGQVHFQRENQGSSLKYTIPTPFPTKQYELTFKICTLHLEQEADLLCVSINGSEACEVPVLYSIGEWVYTDPVKIQLGGGDTLIITRKSGGGKFWGLTMRELLLKPEEQLS